MPASTFSYELYIRATPQQLWSALTEPDLMQQYWFGVRGESAWTAGSPWQLVSGAGQVLDSGEILEADPPRRLVIRSRIEWDAEIRAEGFARCVIELGPTKKEAATRLAITHSMERESSKAIEAVADAWPKILCNLKSLLESGSTLL